MMIPAVAAILDRDLRALQRAIEAYPDDTQLWRTVSGVTNSAGTLTLHLTGNLQHFIGARLGDTGYVRDRAAEFGRRDVSRAELARKVAAARLAVAGTLATLEEDQLAEDFPDVVGGARVATGEFLIHLACHFAYHLGQIDYHRRFVTGQTTGIDALRPAELGSARPVPA